MVYQQGDRCSGVPGGSWHGRFGPPSRSELDWRHAAICQELWTYARECPWSYPESCLWACQVSVSCLGMPIFKHIDRIQYTCRGCPKHLGLALVCLPGYRGALANAAATVSDSVSARPT